VFRRKNFEAISDIRLTEIDIISKYFLMSTVDYSRMSYARKLKRFSDYIEGRYRVYIEEYNK
jgi:hypothetical protein